MGKLWIEKNSKKSANPVGTPGKKSWKSTAVKKMSLPIGTLRKYIASSRGKTCRLVVRDSVNGTMCKA